MCGFFNSWICRFIDPKHNYDHKEVRRRLLADFFIGGESFLKI